MVRPVCSYRGDGELEKSSRELDHHEQVISTAKSKINKLQQLISATDKVLADSNATFRNLQDNQTLRKAVLEIQSFDRQIDELNEEEARQSARKYNEQYHKHRTDQTNLQSEQAKVGGEISMMKADAEQKKVELNDEYNQIEQRYRTELIKVKTAEIANKDLEKYHKALDAYIAPSTSRSQSGRAAC